MSDNQKMYDRFSNDVLHMIVFAKAASIDAHVDCLYPESFLIGTLLTGENIVTMSLNDHDVDLDKCVKRFKHRLTSRQKDNEGGEQSGVTYDEVNISKEIIDICKKANEVSLTHNHKIVGLGHLFVAIMELHIDLRQIISKECKNFKDCLSEMIHNKYNKTTSTPQKRNKRKNKDSIIDQYCIDMTEMANNGDFDPILSRDAEIEEAITILCRRTKSNPILVGEAGVGKAQPLNSKVLTPKGFVNMGDIKKGDKVIAQDGTESLVTGVFPQGEKDVYRVTFSDGRSTKCCNEHLWDIYGPYGENYKTENGSKARKYKYRTMSLDTIIDRTQNVKRFKALIPLYRPIGTYDEELPIDPWMLGFLLGDGCFRDGRISSYSTSDKEIVEKISSILPNEYKTTKRKGSKYDYDIVFKDFKESSKGTYCRGGNRSHEIKKRIEELGLFDKMSSEKFIPEIYKKSSLSNKIKLISGLVDSDGHVGKNGNLSISTSSEVMAEDIQDLVWSIGGIAKISQRIGKYKKNGLVKICKTSYKVSIKYHTPKDLATLQRKVDRLPGDNYQYKDRKLEMKGITYVGKEVCQCIMIDHPNQLYITDDYIVTHNTAIVEGISQRIISKAVPKKLRNCKIYSLNMSGMVAGTKYRGDFEKRMQDLIKAVEDDQECILFIDEIHTIVGAGGAGSAMDAANILKPALARKLKCIGATTHQEYKKHFLEDGALSRRFGTVNIDEPSDEDVKKILMGIKERFESYHECTISNDAIDSIIELTKRYRPTKFFPDKAIDCMDTACAKYAWKDKEDGIIPVINSDDIAQVISKQCQVPLEVIQWDSNERIKKTESFLRDKVVGQEEAVKSVCRVLRNAYSGVRNPDRPIGVLVFGGQSGTGKTYLSKQLSEAIFGSDKSLIRIDMTEYSEEHSMSKIIGSPPGYVGFKDVDVVVDKIKRRPYCILLLDEIEKANPKVLKLFLQVMQDGIITSAIGEKIDCKNIFFIMTGNFGMNDSKTSAMGFAGKKKSLVDNERERLVDFCEKAYGKEFSNRIDAFVPFLELSEDNLVDIAQMRLSEFTERVNNKNIRVSIDQKVASAIVRTQEKDHGMNAMAIDRLISKRVQPLVADAILDIEDADAFGYTLTVTLNRKGELVIRKRKRKKKKVS